MTSLSVVGKGYHLDEHVTGFYNSGYRIRFWGTRGAFWGGLCSLFFGGLFVSVPLAGSVIVLGYVATAVLSAIEGALVVGSMSALGAALFGLRPPLKASIISTPIMAVTSMFEMSTCQASGTASGFMAKSARSFR